MNYIKKQLFALFFILSISIVSQTTYNIADFNGQTVEVVCADGSIFTDSNAGAGDTYEAGENYVVTYCPEVIGQAIELDFTSFWLAGLQGGNATLFDYITVYNGVADYAAGTGTSYTGNDAFTCNNCPPDEGVSAQITSDNPEGCLVIEFVSNDDTNIKPGWEAIISCWEPCQEISNPLITTTPVLTDFQLTVDVDEVVTFQGSADFAVSSASAVYTWDFGDGTTGIGQNPEYTYTSAGIFDVSLTISDSSCTDDSTTIIAVPIQVIVGSGSAGFAYVDAGEDVLLGCDTSTQLSASFLDIGETTSYLITEIPFVPPFPFAGLESSIPVNIDDI